MRSESNTRQRFKSRECPSHRLERLQAQQSQRHKQATCGGGPTTVDDAGQAHGYTWVPRARACSFYLYKSATNFGSKVTPWCQAGSDSTSASPIWRDRLAWPPACCRQALQPMPRRNKQVFCLISTTYFVLGYSAIIDCLVNAVSPVMRVHLFYSGRATPSSLYNCVINMRLEL